MSSELNVVDNVTPDSASTAVGMMRMLADGCGDLYRAGWAENHAGNVSIRLTKGELEAYDLRSDYPVVPLSTPVPQLARESFLVTSAGSPFRVLTRDPAAHSGIITVQDDGSSYQVRWGFPEDRHPTSELPAHLRGHAAALDDRPDTRVLLHCHPTNVIAMTQVHSLDEVEFTRSLWATNSESILAIPHGVGILPWMVCGTDDIGAESAAKLGSHSLVIWASHGVLVSGSSLHQVIGTVESVDKAAGTWLLTRWGQRHAITDNQLLELAVAFGIEPPSRFLSPS